MNALATPPQMMLGGFCLLVLAAIAYEVAAPLPDFDSQSPIAATRPPPQIALPEFHPPSSEEFAEIDARPVFDRARQPITPDASAAAQGAGIGNGGTPPVASLVGVIIDGSRRLALIRSQASPLATSVGVGDMVAGWRVTEIDADKVVLRSGPNTDEIRLDQNHPENTAGPTPQGTAGAAGTGAPTAGAGTVVPGSATVAGPASVPDNTPPEAVSPPPPH